MISNERFSMIPWFVWGVLGPMDKALNILHLGLLHLNFLCSILLETKIVSDIYIRSRLACEKDVGNMWYSVCSNCVFTHGFFFLRLAGSYIVVIVVKNALQQTNFMPWFVCMICWLGNGRSMILVKTKLIMHKITTLIWEGINIMIFWNKCPPLGTLDVRSSRIHSFHAINTLQLCNST